jgi:hypothetical protein
MAKGHKKKKKTPPGRGRPNPSPPPPPPPLPPGTRNEWFPAANQASINEIGIREVSVNMQGYVHANAATARNYANLMVTALSRDEQLVSLEICEPPEDPTFYSKFREGDAIDVDLANSGRSGQMIARSRAYDSNRGTMLVSGEANLHD